MEHSSNDSLASAMGEGRTTGSVGSVMRWGTVCGKLQRKMVEYTPSCGFLHWPFLPDVAGRCPDPHRRYDVSGVPPERIEEIIKFDWKHLVFNKRIFDSSSYLREKGKPVVALWGIDLLFSLASLHRA